MNRIYIFLLILSCFYIQTSIASHIQSASSSKAADELDDIITLPRKFIFEFDSFATQTLKERVSTPNKLEEYDAYSSILFFGMQKKSFDSEQKSFIRKLKEMAKTTASLRYEAIDFFLLPLTQRNFLKREELKAAYIENLIELVFQRDLYQRTYKVSARPFGYFYEPDPYIPESSFIKINPMDFGIYFDYLVSKATSLVNDSHKIKENREEIYPMHGILPFETPPRITSDGNINIASPNVESDGNLPAENL